MLKLSRCLRAGMFIFLTGLLLPAAHAQESGAPQEAVSLFLETIRKMEFPVTDSAAQRALADQANRLLDLEAMSSKALKEHWQDATPEQRNTFLDRMGKLVEEVAYPRSVEFLGKLEIQYPEVNVHEATAEVHSLVVHETAALNAPVVYRLRKQGDGWVIADVLLDNVSISDDLNYQFDKIIRDSSFDGLLDKMNERLERAREANRTAAT